MIFFKLLGAVLLIGSGFGFAYRLNREIMISLAQTEGFLRLLRHIQVKVECFSLPMAGILASADPLLLRACGYERMETPTELSELLEGCRIRDEESYRLMTSFSAEFGRGYREEQKRECEYYFSLLEQRRQAISEALPLKKRRNSALCISGALSAVIILL